MNAGRHTPGPWEFDGDARVDAVAFRKAFTWKDQEGVEHTSIDGLVALPYGCGDIDTHRANALLIAAAPELLAELQQTTFLLTSACLLIEDAQARQTALTAVNRARAVIAKATGSAP